MQFSISSEPCTKDCQQREKGKTSEKHSNGPETSGHCEVVVTITRRKSPKQGAVTTEEVS